jgi:hypothetical protein
VLRGYPASSSAYAWHCCTAIATAAVLARHPNGGLCHLSMDVCVDKEYTQGIHDDDDMTNIGREPKQCVDVCCLEAMISEMHIPCAGAWCAMVPEG